jgi:hypothetical protein
MPTAKRPKAGDEVYIPSLKLYGKVIHASPAAENPEDEFFKVQILHYFRPADLEVYDPEEERKERETILRRKKERWDHANRRLQEFLSKGGNATSAEAAELGFQALTAATELWKELNRFSSK